MGEFLNRILLHCFYPLYKIICKKNPSETLNNFWIIAYRNKGVYPSSNTIKSGKWLIFTNINEVDLLWQTIKSATENGLLGNSSKVATAKPNPNAKDPNEKVICVYTYNFEDKDDVMRVRQVLRSLGITKKIPYKTDIKTLQGEYQINGKNRISLYYE
ncbi:MAG: DUF1917 domain-containing protein [Chitinophagaceae bacterium]|nr:DUF1917 domain-containing protein [Chitinophagaceae bacterium]